MNITINIEVLVECEINPIDAARMFKYCIGDDAVSDLYKYVGRLALNKKDLDNVGLSTDNVKLFRFVYLVTKALNEGVA